MRATITVDDELLRSAKDYTGLEGTSEIVSEALKAFVQQQAARRLAKMGGTQPDLRPVPRRRSA